MRCVYCECTFKLTKFTKTSNVCPECEGVTDDLSIPDEELVTEIQILKNPSGKTKVTKYDDYYDDYGYEE